MRFVAILLLFPVITCAQVGGSDGYQILDLTTNPRAAALAGSTVSMADGDISQFFENPATLDSVSAGSAFFHYNPYFVDLNAFTGAYAFDVNKLGVFSVGLNYLGYGSFEATDPTGNVIGSFNAQDYVLTVGKAHRLGPVILGASLKVIHSSIESYGSTAIAGDIGGVFRVNKNWTIGMVFANLGGRVSNFNELSSPNLPLDVKVGTTFKPQYMPLRFTLTSSNLMDRNIVEESGNQGRSNSEFERVLRRINFGAELVLSDNFQLLVGYNHKRKQELKLEETGEGAGFSYGLMVGIKQFRLRFSRATYHAAGGSSFISFQTNLKAFDRIL